MQTMTEKTLNLSLKAIGVAIIALVALGFIRSAFAATPVAVFEGSSLNGGTVGGYTLNLNGNTYADGAVTITSTTKGLSLTSSSTWSGNSDGITAVIRYSSLVKGSGSKQLVSFKLSDKKDCLGVRMDTNGTSAGTYDGNGSWSSEGSGSTKGVAIASSDTVFVAFKDSEYTKAFGTNDTYARGAKTLYYGSNLREGNKNVGDLITIASMDNGSNVASGMVITGIAIYKGFMSDSERAAFAWSSEGTKENAFLWLDASQNITKSGDNVTKWTTLSTSGKYAETYSGMSSPTVSSASELGGRSVVDFGSAGSGKDLKIPAASNIRAVFMVTAIDDSPNAFILGGDTTSFPNSSFNFHRGTENSNVPYFSGNAIQALRDGQIRRNREAKTYSTAIGTGYGLITLIPTAGVCASRICQDRDQTGRNGGKKIAELIIFTVPITDDQRNNIETYLMNKWFPKHTATVTGDADLSKLEWNPAMPTGGFAPNAELTINNTAAAKVTVDTAVSVVTLTVQNASDKELKLGNFANLTVSSFDFSQAAGGVGIDIPNGWAVADPLKSYLRNNDVKVAFYGADGKGATIDYGVGNTTSTKGHHVFDVGTHALTYGANSAILSFSSTGTLDNPGILVRDGATLNFTMKDLNGWNGTRQDNAVMRVASGGTLNFLPNGTSTMFMSGRLVMEPGSTTTFKTGSANYGFCVYGGADASSDTTKAQLYVPSPAQGAENTTAVLKKNSTSTKNLEFGKSSEGTGGAAITVSTGSTLDVQSPISGAQAVNKYGHGTVKFSDAVSEYSGNFTIATGKVQLGKVFDSYDVSSAKFYGPTAGTLSFDLGKGNTMSVTGTTTDSNRKNGLEVTSGTLDFNTDYSSTGVTPFAGRTVTADGADAVIKLSKSDATGWSSAGTAIAIKNGATMSIVKRDTLMTPVTLAGGTIVLEAGCGSSERGLDLFGNMSGSTKTVNAWNVSGNSAITVATTASNEAGDNKILLRDKNWEVTVAEGGEFTVGAELITRITAGASGTRGKLVKKGAGKIVLTNSSSYDTGTEVQEGTLKVTASSALGTDAVSVSSGAKIELEVPENVAYTVGNAISGEGRIEKLGAGSFTLSGNNTFTGGTTISEGVLVLGSDSALSGTVTLTANGQLDLYGHSATVTIVGSGTICNSSETTAHINGIPVDAGKELTFTEGKTSIIVPEGETLTLTALPPNGTVTIGGAGKVAYTTTAEAPAYPTWTWIADGDDAWTGTYALTGFTTATTQTCGENGWDLRPYYNGTNSVFEIVGGSASATVEGYFNNVSISVGELVLSGAVKIVNGYSNYTYSFTKISGSKAFTVNTSNTITATVKFADISEFTGTLSVSSPKNSDKKCYCVIVGDGTLPEGYTSDMSSIYLTGDTVLNGTTLNVSNGVKVNGDAVVTVPAGKRPTCSSGAMTLEDGSSVVFGNGSCNLTANGGLSIASNVKIPLTITNGKDLTAGAILINWSGTQPTGDFSFSIESGVEAGHSGFKASKNASNLTAIADTSKTYYEVEGGETTTFDNTWLETAGVKGETAEATQTALNKENANGIKMSDVYLMGYEAKDAQNAAVILKPDQAQSNGETISLSVAGVPATTRNGASITYTAQSSANRDWTNPTEAEMGASRSVSMELPTSGVLYYRVQANVALP